MRLVTLEYQQALTLEKMGFFRWRNLLRDLLISNAPPRYHTDIIHECPSGFPTVVEALKWLRDEHNLHVVMTFSTDVCYPHVYQCIDGEYQLLYKGAAECSVAMEHAELLILNWCLKHINNPCT